MQSLEKQILIETNKGNITVKLYNGTPHHRDNFLKLAEEGLYDSLLFHRVIKKFMIQAGDPNSKNAPLDSLLGEGSIGYCLLPEFNQAYFHKRGALAAARQGDDVNPKKESDGSQFYIVTGKVFSPVQLDNIEREINDGHYQAVLDSLKKPHLKELYMLRRTGENAALLDLQDSIDAAARREVAKEPPFAFTEMQRKVYTTVGGAPHLDGNYTVFGEVVDGWDVVNAIQQVKTNRADRPVENIMIKKMTVLP